MERKDYENFVENFSDNLKIFNSKISFFIYGSFLREDFIPGVSDLDGFLVLENNDFVIDKDELISLSTSLYWHNSKKLKLQFGVFDESTVKDGRFFSYPKHYLNFFKDNSKRVFGYFDLDKANAFDYKHPELSSISHNIFKLRQNFLNYSSNFFERKNESLEKIIYSPIKKLSQLPKQLINLRFGTLIEDKEASLETFLEIFPNYDFNFLKENNLVLKNYEKHSFFGKDFDKGLEYSLNCLTEIEKMIKAYVEKFSGVSSREVKF